MSRSKPRNGSAEVEYKATELQRLTQDAVMLLRHWHWLCKERGDGTFLLHSNPFVKRIQNVQTELKPVEELKQATPARAKSKRIAAIDWMRGLVMVLMTVDHASMAFDRNHLAEDSALYADTANRPLPGGEFVTRWMTHLCAPTFVLLAGTSLAMSVERRVARNENGRQIDRGLLIRGALIALLDPTVISIATAQWNFSVLFAIGLSMICMVLLRRFPSWLLLTLALGWIALGEFPTSWAWHPPGSASPLAAFTVATYGGSTMIIKYPLLPWLSMMVLGWVFGRYMIQFAAGTSRISPRAILLVGGLTALAIFAVVRGFQGYGDMFLHRTDNSWQQWLHVSKYPPSLTYITLELGLLSLCLAALMTIEPLIGVRQNGVFLVFGQTAMFFYLAHRLILDVPANYFGLRGAGNLATTYMVSAGVLAFLYPCCLWYRRFKAAHPNTMLKYF